MYGLRPATVYVNLKKIGRMAELVGFDGKYVQARLISGRKTIKVDLNASKMTNVKNIVERRVNDYQNVWIDIDTGLITPHDAEELKQASWSVEATQLIVALVAENIDARGLVQALSMSGFKPKAKVIKNYLGGWTVEGDVSVGDIVYDYNKHINETRS